MQSFFVYIRPIPDAGNWLPHPEPYRRKAANDGGFYAEVTFAPYLADWLPHPDIGGPGPQPPFPGGGGPGGPGGGDPPHPSHPIFYPPGTSPGYPGWGGSRPHPEFPIAGPPWFPQQPGGGGPGGGGEGPLRPWYEPILPPGTTTPPAQRPPSGPPPGPPPDGYQWIYTFIYGTGWMWVLVPTTPPAGTTPPPEGTTPPAPDQQTGQQKSNVPPGVAAIKARS